MQARPTVIVFDVNETLLDIVPLEPLFARWFGDKAVMREWFAQLVLYSQTLTLAGSYLDFAELAVASLGMIADIRRLTLPAEANQHLKLTIGSLPAHPDVRESLGRLKASGFRLVTLTNSGGATQRAQLEAAGIAQLFEAQFSVEAVRAFKPARSTYGSVANALGLPINQTMMVACHSWDLIGARAAGCQTGFIRRIGNAELDIAGARADVAADTLHAFAECLGGN